MEKHFRALEIKAVSDDGAGYIEGYGAIKGNIDSYGDVIKDGAFTDLDEFVKRGFMGEGHNWETPIGYIVDAKEDQLGLFVKMAFHNTPDAQAARKKVAERMAADKFVGLSIGFYTKVSSYGEIEGREVRFLESIETAEISIVTVPANKRAGATSIKSGASVPRLQQFAEVRQSVADYLSRMADMKDLRGDEWKAERAQELRSIATEITNTIDFLDVPKTKGGNASIALISRALELAGLPQ